MDPELRESLAALMRMGADTNRELRAQGATLGELVARVGKLEGAVFGSEPPPAPPVRALIARISHNELEDDAFRGQLLATVARVERIEKDLRSHMGLGAKGLRFLATREGQKAIVAFATLIMVIASLLRGLTGAPAAVPLEAPRAQAAEVRP